MITCTIGVMAYNEEANIGRLFEALSNQVLSVCTIKEIIVVASGCTDRTEEIVRDYIKRDSRIRLFSQQLREGKASAINLFLSNVSTDVVVLESADTIPEPDTIENLVKPFLEPVIGMTGGHPVPMDNARKFIGFTTHLLWNLHHELALINPKLGEIVAFRGNVVSQIPMDTITDEACLEAIFTNKGYRLHYVPEAIVKNKGQGSVAEFINRRRNLYAGHIQLIQRYGYAPSTTNVTLILKLLLRQMMSNSGLRSILFTFMSMALEGWVRILGMADYYIKKDNLHIWKIAKHSKTLEE
ncbi:glycosyltransferase [Candidatus Desantisbacteria bacterium]|nr:glycosyltransferase [Candidatus Desantisbacteria bacterium]